MTAKKVAQEIVFELLQADTSTFVPTDTWVPLQYIRHQRALKAYGEYMRVKGVKEGLTQARAIVEKYV